MKKLMFFVMGIIAMSVMSCGHKAAVCEDGCDSTVVEDDSLFIVDSIGADTVFADTVVEAE